MLEFVAGTSINKGHPLNCHAYLEVRIKANKMIGVLLLIFTVYTIIGMVLANDAFWGVYNYVTLIFSVISGIVLLKQK